MAASYLATLRNLEAGLSEPSATAARELRGILELEGALDPRVLADAGSDGAAELLALALPGAAQEPELVKRVEELLAAARRAGRRLAAERLREAPGLGDAEAVLLRQRRQREEEEATTRRQEPGEGRPWTPRGGAKLRMPRRGQGHDGLADRDAKLRQKWVERFVATLANSEVPAAKAARAAGDPARMLAGLAGKARASTLRIRVRTWERMARWLEAKCGHSWPQSAEEVLDYLWAVMDEAPVASLPGQLRAGLRWYEHRSGLPEDAHLSRSDLLCRHLELAEQEALGNGPDRRKAPRLPGIMLAALEVMVCEPGDFVALRVAAWTRLLKAYGVLRADDLQRMAPADVELRESGFVGVLRQTKTTGMGKKVRSLMVYVPFDLYVADPKWLEVGYHLWREAAPFERDFFLPRALPDFTGFVKRLAEVSDMAALNTVVLSFLKVPEVVASVDGEKAFRGGAARLVPSGLELAWTGHSERATLPSALAALGVPKGERDPLGRWPPSGSDDYVRSYKALVKKVGKVFVKAVRSPNAYHDLDEEDALIEARASAGRRHRGDEIPEVDFGGLVESSKKFYRDIQDYFVTEVEDVKFTEVEKPMDLAGETGGNPMPRGKKQNSSSPAPSGAL